MFILSVGLCDSYHTSLRSAIVAAFIETGHTIAWERILRVIPKMRDALMTAFEWPLEMVEGVKRDELSMSDNVPFRIQRAFQHQVLEWLLSSTDSCFIDEVIAVMIDNWSPENLLVGIPGEDEYWGEQCEYFKIREISVYHEHDLLAKLKTGSNSLKTGSNSSADAKTFTCTCRGAPFIAPDDAW